MVNVWVTNQRPMGQLGDMRVERNDGHTGDGGCQEIRREEIGFESRVGCAALSQLVKVGRKADLTMRQVTTVRGVLRRGGLVGQTSSEGRVSILRKNYWNTWWSFFARFLETLVKKLVKKVILF